MKTKEEILLAHVGHPALSGLKWKSLNDRKDRIYEAMEEYASQQTEANEKELSDFKDLVRSLRNADKANDMTAYRELAKNVDKILGL